MKAPYGFGQSQEDERTESEALGLPGGRILSIASAGDMPLSLLALGADSVTAVDIDPGQVHLGQLKLAAALRLEPPQAVRFLGLMPAPAPLRRDWFAAVRSFLPETAREWWDPRTADIEAGVVSAGRYERFIGRVRLVLGHWLRPRVEALVDAPDLEAQREIFDHQLDRPLLRSVFRMVFHPRLYSGRGVDARALQHRGSEVPIGDLYFERFRKLCTASPAAENPYLQLNLLGHVISDDVVPSWLTESGVAVLRARSEQIRFRVGDIREFLHASPPKTFDGYHLSNTPDWLSEDEFEELLTTVASRTARPARLVWRSLHSEVPVPGTLESTIRPDPGLGRALVLKDRFPLYFVIPAGVAG